MAVQGVSETVEVTAAITPMIEKDSTALKSGVSSETIQSLPVGQEYRDLIKLIPGVMYTQDGTRGPSAGGSGQDNVYKFDGVNVTMPLYGTLSAEPASHDIAQVTTIKGGAKAVDFDRAGGFTVDSVSKSGTNRFQGLFSYQFQNDSMAADLTSGQPLAVREEQPVDHRERRRADLEEQALLLRLVLSPRVQPRRTASNLYGELPDYNSTRNEGFGKVTYTPTSSILINGSWRQSHTPATGVDLLLGVRARRPGAAASRGRRSARSTPRGSSTPRASHPSSTRTTRTRRRARPTTSRRPCPTLVDRDEARPRRGSTHLGAFNVPTPVAGQDAFNAFIQPLIDRYGYTSNGVKTGGGTVGYASTLSDADDFFRDAFQVAYNIDARAARSATTSTRASSGRKDAEDLNRSSNGWGVINVPGGRSASIGLPGQPALLLRGIPDAVVGVEARHPRRVRSR